MTADWVPCKAGQGYWHKSEELKSLCLICNDSKDNTTVGSVANYWRDRAEVAESKLEAIIEILFPAEERARP